MQDVVQAAVLRLADRSSTVNPDDIRLECPGADPRDVARAVALLMDDDMIVVPPTSAGFTGTLVGVSLTEHGAARLAATDAGPSLGCRQRCRGAAWVDSPKLVSQRPLAHS